jgi:hypothetical protein
MRLTSTLPYVLAIAACTGQETDKIDGRVDTDIDTNLPIDSPIADTSDTDISTSDTDTTPPKPGPIAEITEGGQIVCDDPSLREARFFDQRNAFEMPLDPETGQNLIGGGIAIGDYDADGDLDLFIPGDLDYQLWILDDNGAYIDESKARMPGLDISRATAASTADFDGDGDLDIYVTRFHENNVLLVNSDGQGHFVDGTVAAGLDASGLRSIASAWGDFTGDGYLDLFVSNYGPHPNTAYVDSGQDFEIGDPSFLYTNDGDGTFTDVSDTLPAEVHDAHVFMAAWQDMDNDRDLDLITIHDFGWNRPNQLLWNDGGTLVRDDGTAQFGIEFAGMGLGIGDINGDEIPDFVQSSWKDISVLESTGGKWWEYSPQRLPGAPIEESPYNRIFGWGTEFADIDIDGDLDIVMAYGQWDEYQEHGLSELDALYIQEETAQGQPLFTDQAETWGIDDGGATRGLLVVDLNEDGYPDVIKRMLDGATKMYLTRCGEGNWTKVRLHLPGPNTFGIGTRIKVVTSSGSQVRWVHAGSTSMFSGTAPEVHFGLGEDEQVLELLVYWPDGETSTFTNLAARQVLDVTRLP